MVAQQSNHENNMEINVKRNVSKILPADLSYEIIELKFKKNGSSY